MRFVVPQDGSGVFCSYFSNIFRGTSISGTGLSLIESWGFVLPLDMSFITGVLNWSGKYTLDREWLNKCFSFVMPISSVFHDSFFLY